VGFYAAYNAALDVIQALGFWVLGAFIFWRRSDDRMGLTISLMLVSFGSLGTTNYVLYALESGDLVWWMLSKFVQSIALITFFVSFYTFPDGSFVPRWTRVVTVVFIVYHVPYTFIPFTGRGTLFDLAYDLLLLYLLCAVVLAQIYRYARVSGTVERQQTKWVVFGLTATIAILVVTSWVAVFFPQLRQPDVLGMLYTLGSRTVWNLSLLLIPFSIGIAILRYRLYDIDAVINRSLVYGTLTTVLAGVFAITDTLLLPLLVRSVLGKEDPTLNAVIAALVIAMIFEPLRRRISVGVDTFTDWLAGGPGAGESPR